MRRKAIVYQDVYLDGYDNHFFADRKAARLLSPEGAKRARWFRSAFLNRRFFHYMFFVGLALHDVLHYFHSTLRGHRNED